MNLGGWSSADSIYFAAVNYNGDGILSTNTGTISNGALTVNDADGVFSGTISAAEGSNYAASSLVFYYTASLTPATATYGLFDENDVEYYPIRIMLY